jgi:Holliday junction resolvase RusA-like endonuclease
VVNRETVRTYFIAGVNPEPWAVGTLGVRRQTTGKPTPYMAPNEQLVAYQKAIREELLSQNPPKPTSNVPNKLVFFFYRRLDEYQVGSKTLRRHVADATNLQKALEDALQGILIDNDRNVTNITSIVVEQGPDTDPGVMILHEINPYPGAIDIFKKDLLHLRELRENTASSVLDLGNNI